MAEEFYYYPYPFFFPKEFLKFEGKYDREIKTEFLHAMSTVSLRKKLDLENLLGRFSVSNLRKTEIKKRILFLLDLLQKENCIESQFELIEKSETLQNQTELNLTLLSQTRSLYFFEKELD